MKNGIPDDLLSDFVDLRGELIDVSEIKHAFDDLVARQRSGERVRIGNGFPLVPLDYRKGVANAFSEQIQRETAAVLFSLNNLASPQNSETPSDLLEFFDAIVVTGEGGVIDVENTFVNALLLALRAWKQNGRKLEAVRERASSFLTTMMVEGLDYALGLHPLVKAAIMNHGPRVVGWLLRYGKKGIEKLESYARGRIDLKENNMPVAAVSRAVVEAAKRTGTVAGRGPAKPGGSTQPPKQLSNVDKQQTELVVVDQSDDSEEQSVQYEVLNTREVADLTPQQKAIIRGSATNKSEDAGRLTSTESFSPQKCQVTTSNFGGLTLEEAYESRTRIALLEEILNLKGKRVGNRRSSEVLLALLQCINLEDFKNVSILEKFNA